MSTDSLLRAVLLYSSIITPLLILTQTYKINLYYLLRVWSSGHRLQIYLFKETKMAISRQRRNAVYGVGQPLYDLNPQPSSSTRAPTTSDMAELNTIWTNRSTNVAYVLASIVSNSATWTPASVNAGVQVDTGDVRLETGSLVLVAGDIFVAAGDASLTLGDLNVFAGDINVPLGDITGRGLFAMGDEGTGVAAQTLFTNVTDETLGAGNGAVLMKTGNPGNSSGWMKIYSGTDVRWVPYWTNISP